MSNFISETLINDIAKRAYHQAKQEFQYSNSMYFDSRLGKLVISRRCCGQMIVKSKAHLSTLALEPKLKELLRLSFDRDLNPEEIMSLRAFIKIV